jgi:hypothetical protein
LLLLELGKRRFLSLVGAASASAIRTGAPAVAWVAVVNGCKRGALAEFFLAWLLALVIFGA